MGATNVELEVFDKSWDTSLGLSLCGLLARAGFTELLLAAAP